MVKTIVKNVTVKVPPPMRVHVAQQSSVSVDVVGDDLASVFADLKKQYPELVERCIDGDVVRQYVNVFLNNTDVRFLEGLKTKVADGDEVLIAPQIVGGHPAVQPETPVEEVDPRYHRQVVFSGVGRDGQVKIEDATVAVIGTGALGSACADHLVRAGVGAGKGEVRIIDRDVVEASNLNRQTLFQSSDVEDQLPKVVAAKAKLERINPDVNVVAKFGHLDHVNVESFLDGVDVIVDGTDNLQTRYLLNDYAVKHGKYFVSAGVAGAAGWVRVFAANCNVCFRCVYPEPAPVDAVETCETTGVLGPTVAFAGALQAVETLKIIVGSPHVATGHATHFDIWENDIRQVPVPCQKPFRCPTCDDHRFEWLSGSRISTATVFCGSDTVQLSPSVESDVDLVKLKDQLPESYRAVLTPFYLSFQYEEVRVRVNKDGLAVFQGVDDANVAQSIYTKVLGV